MYHIVLYLFSACLFGFDKFSCISFHKKACDISADLSSDVSIDLSHDRSYDKLVDISWENYIII